MTPALWLDGVDISFGATRVLRGTTFELAPDERVAVLGANGAGKTTLIRVAAGLAEPQAGAVRAFGIDPCDARARRRIGVVAHEPLLYPQLSALENLRLWARLYDCPGADAAAMLDEVGLDPADPGRVGTYSVGNRRRVSLVRALLHGPELLLADEPFAGLDADGVEAAARLIAGRARAALIATHGPAGAHGFTTRTVRLDGGRLRPDGA